MRKIKESPILNFFKKPSLVKEIIITLVISIILVILCPIVTDAIILDGKEWFNTIDEELYSHIIGRIGQIVIGVGGLVSCVVICKAYRLENTIKDLKNQKDKDNE